ncbi:hypothetical protein ABPG72_013757 [Tetrahymena utriculariae]
MASFKKQNETSEKLDWLQIELKNQYSTNQITNSISKRKMLDLNTYNNNENELKDEWNEEEKIKLEKILQKMKLMKNQQSLIFLMTGHILMKKYNFICPLKFYRKHAHLDLINERQKKLNYSRIQIYN